MTPSAAVALRPMRATDRPEVLELLASSLGWAPDDQHDAFLRWKHEENPFGPSPSWVALDGDEIVGVRMLLRWRFADATGASIEAVRAVDTATRRDRQGLGIFRQLTTAAVESLTADGVAFVFNTPNDSSRPGYLKMGWHVAGRVPVAVRPRGPRSLVAMARSRMPAGKWGVATDAFDAPSAAFADDGEVRALLGLLPSQGAFTTERSPDYLRWRYGFGPLHYRVVLLGDDLRSGAIVFRLRRRGALLEAALAEVLVPPGGRRAARRAVGNVLSVTGADVALAVSTPVAHGLVPVPRIGPLLTSRPLADDRVHRIRDFGLTLGDVELF